MRTLLLLLMSVFAFGQVDTLGTTTIGNADGIPADQPRFNLYTAATTGTILKGYCYQSAAGNHTAKFFVYLDDGNGSPDANDTVVDSSAEATFVGGGWWSFTMLLGGTITAGSKYYIGIYNKPGADTWSYHTAAGGTEWRDPTAGQYAPLPANLGVYTLLTQSKTGSWYITYDATPAASATTKPGLPTIKKLNSIKGYK